MQITVEPVILRGRVQVPPSKSLAHRCLIAAALAGAENLIINPGTAEDVLATRACLANLGTDRPFCCGASGSTLRFLIPVVLALQTGGTFCVSRRLFQRGIGVYEEILPQHGIKIQHSEFGRQNCGRELRGAESAGDGWGSWSFSGTLTPGEYVVPGDVSSQFVSGLLLALPLLPGDSVLRVTAPVESRPYIGMTLAVLEQFGISIQSCRTGEELVFHISGHQQYRPCGQGVQVEGDWSNGAVLLAMNALGAELQIEGLREDSCQGDRVIVPYLQKLQTACDCMELDLTDCPDLGPLLFAVAAALGRRVRFLGTRRLRMKESDRVAAMLQELTKFGVKAQTGENYVEIAAGKLHRPAEILEGHNDHRIVMALTVLTTVTGGTIAGAEAVSKSWPEFFREVRVQGLANRVETRANRVKG